MTSPVTETFIQETLDGLEDLEGRLLSLEADPSPEQVDNIFRILHTIKGSGAMFGFEPLSRFTHHFETAFDLVREGKLSMSKELIDVALDSRDYMGALLEANGHDERINELEGSDLTKSLIKRITDQIALADGASVAGAEASEQTQVEAGGKTAERLVRIKFKPDPNALRNGTRPDLLIGELAELGEISVRHDESDVPSLEDIDPQLSYLTWLIELKTAASKQDIENVFIFADDADLVIEEDAPAEPAPGVDDVVSESASEGPAEAEDVAPSNVRAMNKNTKKADIMRVPASRLDELMDQLGELVIAQARLDQISARLKDPNLVSAAEEIERLVTGLRDATLSMRMLPIEVVFGKFRRVVRSLSEELGKDVVLVTEGGETELDKNVIDSLTEPLVHMIRNSIDHGIESNEQREKAGKPSSGSVFLSARQSGGEVLISVADDGGGLNAEAIRERALERGMIQPDDEISEADLHRFIFAPAFSTAKSLSSVSGRGVGMDAVSKVVSELRGSIDIETLPGQGTRITLRLPVTLAIIDGLLVRVGDGVFVVPLNSVSECVELSQLERQRESGRTLLQIRDELVPFLNLDEIFGFPKSEEDTRRVVIVSTEGRRFGFVVDDTLGQHQTVIKTFSRFHRDVEGFTGSTILGDGSVALILDVPALLKSAGAVRELSQDAA